MAARALESRLRLRPHDSVLVRYAEDPALWHERKILLAWGSEEDVEQADWVVCATPDRYVYTMKLGEAGRFREAPVLLQAGALPAARVRCYLMEDADGPIGAMEFEELVEEARRVRGVERQALGLVEQPPLWSPPPAGCTWVALREADQIGYGAKVSGLGVRWDSPLFGSKAVRLKDGQQGHIPVELALDAGEPGAPAEDVARTESTADVRTLAVVFERGGGRWRRLDSAAPEMTEVDMPDFPLEGPRSSLWLVQQLSRN